MNRVFFLISVALLCVGCGPRYVVKNNYIPPTSGNAKECLSICEQSSQLCQKSCQSRYQICLDSAMIKAQEIEQRERKEYDIAYQRYQMDYMIYQREFHRWKRDYNNYSRDLSYFHNLCERERDGNACRKRDDLRRYLSRLSHERPEEPWIPARPTYEQILVNQQSFCTTQCGCEQQYDTCFVGCGGQVIPYKMCVENCD